MPPKDDEKPMTLNQFIQFYHQTILPQFERTHSFEQEVLMFRGETLGRFDAVFKRLEDLRQEQLVTHYQLNIIDNRLNNLDHQVGILESR